MAEYVAPLREMRFLMNEVAGLDAVAKLPGNEEVSPDLVDAILDEAARFAEEVISPLNIVGDRVGAKWEDRKVTMPAGFGDAYRLFAESGWTALSPDPKYGGQGLPKLVSAAVNEMWKSSNIAFSLCPMLTQGAIEAVMIAGSDALKDKFLPKMVDGTWSGTMNLTEPQAGSDLAAVRTRAEPQADGSYRIYGQKIFITYGEHDMTENIVHLVLGRTPTAPEGVKGISLFVVPKFLVGDDGAIGARNDMTRARVGETMRATPDFDFQLGDAAFGEHLAKQHHIGTQHAATGWALGRNAESGVIMHGARVPALGAAQAMHGAVDFDQLFGACIAMQAVDVLGEHPYAAAFGF